MKRQATDQEKICPNHKGQAYNEFTNFNGKKKKKKTIQSEMGKSISRHFNKNIQIADQHMKRYSSLAIREMKLKPC